MARIMTKRAEFHQAQVNVQFRIVDDDRSYGLQEAQVTILIDTEQEWTNAIDQIHGALAQLTEQLTNAHSD